MGNPVSIVTARPVSSPVNVGVVAPAPLPAPAASQGANAPVNQIIVRGVSVTPFATVVIQIPGPPGPKGLDGAGATPDSLGVYTKAYVDAQLASITTQIDETVLQFPTPSTTWVITHNLGKRHPQVTLVDSSGREIETDLDPQDANTIIATFAGPTAGTAYVN